MVGISAFSKLLFSHTKHKLIMYTLENRDPAYTLDNFRHYMQGYG